MIVFRRSLMLIAFLVVLIMALIWFLPTVVRHGLTLAGVDDVTFETLEIGLRQTRLEQLVLGDPKEQRITALQIDYSLAGLLGGDIDRIDIDGLYVRAALTEEGLRLPGDQSGDAPSFPLVLTPKEVVVRDSKLDIETPRGLVTIPLLARFQSEDNHLRFDVESRKAGLSTDNGALSADIDISGEWPFSETPAFNQIAATGSLSLFAADATVANLVEALNAEGQIQLDLAGGVMTASSRSIQGDADRLFLGDQSREGPWQATLGGPATPIELRASREGEGVHLVIAGPAALSSEIGAAKARMHADIELDDHYRITRVNRGDLSVDLSNIALEKATLETGRIEMAIEGPGDALTGRLDLGLDRLGYASADLVLEGVTLERALQLSLSERILTIAPIADGKKISVDKMIIDDRVESGWFTIQWHQSETPWLRIDLDDQRFEQRIAAEIDPVRLDVQSERFWARIEALDVAIAGDQTGLTSGRVAFKRGRVDLPSSNIALVGIESVLLLDRDGLAAGQPIPLVVQLVRPLETPRQFAPFRLDTVIDMDGERFSFQGQVTSKTKPSAEVDFSGRHDPKGREGALALKLAPLTLAPDGLQPADLAPALGDVLQDAVGRLGLDGKIAWRDGDLFGDFALLIEELGFTIGPARLERINSVIQFDNIAPLTTPPGQLLSVGLLNVGLPLTDGLVGIELRPDGQLAVGQLVWRLADGRILAEPFSFGSDVQALTMALKAEALDLEALLALTELEGLSGEGKIGGTLPLTIGETAASIAKGELLAEAPGVLRYNPGEAPGALQAGGESVNLMLQALENFHYDALSITLDGRTDGATDIGLHLKGANPDLYDGHPVEFNLNLEGNLASLVQANLDNYQIPDRISERLQDFER